MNLSGSQIAYRLNIYEPLGDLIYLKNVYISDSSTSHCKGYVYTVSFYRFICAIYVGCVVSAAVKSLVMNTDRVNVP